MREHDGGPAFPNITPDMPVDGSPGMTLRDYFAGQALAGCGVPNRPQEIAEWAYMVADAMLAARDGAPPEPR
jgi:hypothetical protein